MHSMKEAELEFPIDTKGSWEPRIHFISVLWELSNTRFVYQRLNASMLITANTRNWPITAGSLSNRSRFHVQKTLFY